MNNDNNFNNNIEQPVVQPEPVIQPQPVVQPEPMPQPAPEPMPQPAPEPMPQPAPEPQPMKSKMSIIYIIIGALLVIIALLVFKLVINKNNNAENQNNIINTNESVQNNDSSQEDDDAFLMAIEDDFTITGRGTVVTGKIERGKIHVNDEVEIVGINETKRTVVTSIELLNSTVDTAKAGDSVALLLRNIEKDEIERGQVVAKPYSIKATTKFEARITLDTIEEGGHEVQFSTNFQPQFYFRTMDFTGTVTLLNNIEKINPGESAAINVELIVPVAMEVATFFTIKEGGKTIGRGVVTEIIN